MIRWYYILLLLSFGSLVSSQQVLKVVTRVVEEEYRYADEFLLEINAEKANIDIKVVDGNTVKLVLEQSAKNKSVKVAEQELAYIHFVAKKERSRLYLNNYAQLKPNSSALTSIINNNYTLEVPRHCHLKIKNELGEVTVKGGGTTMRYDLSYCGLTLNEAKGKLYIDSRVGDVAMIDCNVESEFITENVSIKMQRCGGSYDIQSRFGNVSCLMSENISLINANLEQCEMTLINRSSVEFDYAITVDKGKIETLDDMLKDNIRMVGDESVLMRKDDKAVGTVIIDSEYGDVNLY